MRTLIALLEHVWRVLAHPCEGTIAGLYNILKNNRFQPYRDSSSAPSGHLWKCILQRNEGLFVCLAVVVNARASRHICIFTWKNAFCCAMLRAPAP